MTTDPRTTVTVPVDRSADRRGRDATWLVGLAAGLWGLDALLRKPLATDLPTGTIVLWEHIIPLAILLPLLPRAVRAFARCRVREQAAVVVIGVGSSAVATALFTEAFSLAGRDGDFVTPLVLQKLQPLFAIGLAVALLGERPRPRFALFAAPALVGAWLLAFADPTDVAVGEVVPALLALGAAALWAAGTVLGRLLTTRMTPIEVTALRMLFGLVGALAVVGLTAAPVAPGWGNIPGLVLLAVIPGLLALTLYYRGLRRTPASRASLAELAFPATAAVVGTAVLGTGLSWTQWTGLGVIAASVAAMGSYERP